MRRSSRDRAGAQRLRLLGAGIRDRLSGNHARANARWGHLRPPPGRGRLVWVRAGADAASVRVGAALLAALRNRRRDLRLVLTFEAEHRDLLRTHLAGVERAGFGFGPCDAPRAVRRALARLEPLGVIVAGTPVPPCLAAETAARGIHLIAYQADPPVRGGRSAVVYPADREQARAWRGSRPVAEPAAPADASTLLVEARVEPVLRALVRGGGAERALWWAHGGGVAALIAAWRASPLAADGVLFAGSPDGRNPIPGPPAQAISRWGRGPLDAGTIVWVDDRRWTAAIAAAAAGAYLQEAQAPTVWQALAAGVPMALEPQLAARLRGRYEDFEGIGTPVPDPGAALARWRRWREDAAQVRGLGDRARRRFWAERRRAGAALEALLDRVYDW